MTTHYFVESHLGGTYITDGDPDVIQETCSQCGDSDWIQFSFEDGTSQEELASQLTYYVAERIFWLPAEKSEVDEAVRNYQNEGLPLDEAYEKMIDDMIDVDLFEHFVNHSLKDERLISPATIEILRKNIYRMRNHFEDYIEQEEPLTS